MNPLIPLILDHLLWQQGLVFAGDCAGSCARSDPSCDSLGDRDYVMTPEPAAFEAGTLGHIQKKWLVFIPVLFKPSPKVSLQIAVLKV